MLHEITQICVLCCYGTDTRKTQHDEQWKMVPYGKNTVAHKICIEAVKP